LSNRRTRRCILGDSKADGVRCTRIVIKLDVEVVDKGSTENVLVGYLIVTDHEFTIFCIRIVFKVTCWRNSECDNVGAIFKLNDQIRQDSFVG